MMKEIAKKSEKEKEALVADLKAKCACPRCPTCNNCDKNAKEAAFCILGNSFACISFDRGCNCPKCPLHAQYGMKHRAYYPKGSEMGQRYTHSLWGTSLM